MYRRWSLICRFCVGLAVFVLFIYFSWVTICHRVNAAGSVDFMCGHHSGNIKHRQGYTPMWNLVQDYNTSRDKARRKTPEDGIHTTFKNALSLYADSRDVIVLSLMDTGCLDMGINLYLSSYKRFNITNYIFLSSDDTACPEMLMVAPDIHCIHYADDQDSDSTSSFSSKAFIRKPYLKSKAVQEALLHDYNVLLIDIDVVLFKDPFPYLEKCIDCDLQIQWDHGFVSSGFYYIRSTNGSKLFMEKVWTMAQMGSLKVSEQTAFNKAINGLKGYKGFKHVVLPEKEFLNGQAYFHGERIMFDTNVDFPLTSYLVHHSCNISQTAKIYRFKESSMWYYDKIGYYSNPGQKYLMYQDRFPELRSTTDLQIQALKAALLMGYLLERIIILPSCSCYTCNTKEFGACKVISQECAFFTNLKVEHFDKFFDGLYREHVFLQNNMVPSTVKQSKSKVLIPDTNTDVEVRNPKNIAVFPLKSFQTIKDVTNWFSKYNNVSVLVMDHIQTAWSILSKKFLDGKMNKTLKLAFQHSNYLQE